MNPFVSRITGNQSWVIPVSVLSLVLGFMITVARVTGSESRRTRIGLSDADQRGRLLDGPIDIQEQYKELKTEVGKLRQENTKLQNAMSTDTRSEKLLNQSLQDLKIFAGLTPIEGPGVVVTLVDSDRSLEGNSNDPPPDSPVVDQVIHDRDILRVVNELYSAGAEAVSINNIRLGAMSSVRCVGPVVNIDGIKIASPIRIRAIGDSETLKGALNMPGGVLEEIRETDPRMVTVETLAKVTMPAFSGPTTRRHGSVPKGSA